MRIIILLMLLFLTTSPEPSAAQTPKEMQQQLQQEINELKKQIADTEKEIAAAKARKEEAETIKAMEDDLAMQKQQLSLIEKAAKSMGNIPSSIMNKATKEIIKENDDGYKTIPAKKTALLATIPKETLSKTELATFLTTLNNDLRKKVSAEILTNIQKIIS